MSPEERSALMARIRGKNTGPERLVAEILKSLEVDRPPLSGPVGFLV